MNRKAIAQEFMTKLEHISDINITYENNYDKAIAAISSNGSKVALIEVAESGQYNLSYCLKLCTELKIEMPSCKLLLMCSENDEDIVKQVINSKGLKVIDDFIFYDVSINYLESKLRSI